MPKEKILRLSLTILICLVWFVNGFFCKILNLVPRHQQIVAKILGEDYAWVLTKLIGFAEILIVVWIITRVKSRFCAGFQILVVMLMNVIEFFLAPDLLLFGRMNIVFALLFVILIYIHEFVLNTRRIGTKFA